MKPKLVVGLRNRQVGIQIDVQLISTSEWKEFEFGKGDISKTKGVESEIRDGGIRHRKGLIPKSGKVESEIEGLNLKLKMESEIKGGIRNRGVESEIGGWESELAPKADPTWDTFFGQLNKTT